MSESAEPQVDNHLSNDHLLQALSNDVRQGFFAQKKFLPPIWFYDEKGSVLFEEITHLTEYYPTRAERELLERYSLEMARMANADTLVELGAGSCAKTNLLLDAMKVSGNLIRYIPFDVSEDFLRDATAELMQSYPELEIRAVVGDFNNHLSKIPSQGRRLVAFLGGTIGNLTPLQRKRFLFDLNSVMNHSEYLLIGTDLVKDPKVIVSAYDDAAGVTAAFNRNVLTVLNNRLGANFNPDQFEHIALWNDQEEWVEMRLRATCDLRVAFNELGLECFFEAGEDLLTEVSAKFTPERLQNELFTAGFIVDKMWGIEKGEFMLTLAHPFC